MVEREACLPPKELAIDKGKIRQFFLKHEMDGAELTKARGLVTLGINFRTESEGNIALDYCSTTLAAINGVIANGMYFSSKYLSQYREISLPDSVGFIKNADGVPSVGGRELLLAQSNVKRPEFPNGRIHYSLPYIVFIANKIEGVSKRSDLSSHRYAPGNFLGVTHHEMFHLFQWIHFPEQIARDNLIYEGGGLKAWNNTVSEREARMFGVNFTLAYQLSLRERNLASDFGF